jgi:hypothetical protein
MVSISPRWLSVVAFLAAGTDPARAEDQPAGFVTINVKGVSLHLPGSGPDARDIHFSAFPSRSQEQTPSGSDVLADPERAQKFFATAGTVVVTIPNILDRSGRFLGRFDRSGPVLALSSRNRRMMREAKRTTSTT